MKSKKKYIGTGTEDCPRCLFSSGIVANGKGTICSTCGGTGKVSKRKLREFDEMLNG